MKYSFIIVILLFITIVTPAQQNSSKKSHESGVNGIQSLPNTQSIILPGAYQISQYLPLLKGKRVGVFANHTATIGSVHLVDTLRNLGIQITKAFGPEHGFRGIADAGEKVDTYIDSATGIPVVSLYGKKRKPSAEDLKDVDIMLIDIQDVGTRFYTFISSVQEFLESAIENNKPLIILDRPNPNGFYVDGPVLDTAFKSFVGMQPIPIVYGMTIGEYALYLCGERFKEEAASTLPIQFEALFTEDLISRRKKGNYGAIFSISAAKKVESHFDLFIIPCKNYTHKSKYILPIKPSPNLPDMASIYWYASNCLFEGTVLSEGRGTDHPFCIFGHPSLPTHLFSFTPTSREGAKDPKQKDKLCYGWNLYGTNAQVLQQINNHVQIKYLIEAYRLFPDKDSFFNKPKNGLIKSYGINKLVGNDDLIQQIVEGKSEAEIRASWQPKLRAFKVIRKKYLLYPDFE